MQITVTLDHNDVVAPEMLAFLQSLSISTSADVKTVSKKIETVKKEPLAKAEKVEIEKVEIPVLQKVETANIVSIEQVRAAVQAKAQAGKRVELKAILSTYEVENVTSLSKDVYSEFLTKINAL